MALLSSISYKLANTSISLIERQQSSMLETSSEQSPTTYHLSMHVRLPQAPTTPATKAIHCIGSARSNTQRLSRDHQCSPRESRWHFSLTITCMPPTSSIIPLCHRGRRHVIHGDSTSKGMPSRHLSIPNVRQNPA